MSVSAEGGAREAVENYLFELGCSGTDRIPGGVRGWFPEPYDRARLEQALISFVDNLNEIGEQCSRPELAVVEAEDWSAGWKQYFKPVRIGSRFTVKPPWEQVVDQGRIVIDINPALAFGTGTHETTQLVMELMEPLVTPGCRVLDCGTGSGLLAIAAVLLGAGSVRAFDIDQDALDNAVENSGLNTVSDRIEFICGTLDRVPPDPCDLVFANINRLVLVELIPSFSSYLDRDGHLILSGILSEEAHIIRHALEMAGFGVQDARRKGEWEAVRAVRR
ncbi:50S ribosomal protein L11 methyltransferase [bacterium]|nr:50S ribosomal protein L11 methyltransferase [bacterium]